MKKTLAQINKDLVDKNRQLLSQYRILEGKNQELRDRDEEIYSKIVAIGKAVNKGVFLPREEVLQRVNELVTERNNLRIAMGNYEGREIGFESAAKQENDKLWYMLRVAISDPNIEKVERDIPGDVWQSNCRTNKNAFGQPYPGQVFKEHN